MVKRFLHLSDGTTMEGIGIGSVDQESSGEVVFSTGMTGYGQSITDPSFAGQILTFTYPIIGNYGVAKPRSMDTHLVENFESERVWVSGVVVSSLSSIGSHYQSVVSFSDWLEHEHIPGIAGIDTRQLTIKLREHGSLSGYISSKKSAPSSFPEASRTLVETSSIQERVTYAPSSPNGKHIALIDCGVKHGIIRGLLRNGYKVTRVPYHESPLDISDLSGVIVSNGPGDPKDCQETIHIIQKVLEQNIPYLGICLGNQLLALAIGGDTYKLPFGHRGLNQPCQDMFTRRVYITSQNHGYAVDAKTLPAGYTEWFMNLNDRTNEGIRHTKKPIQSVQFHPEGCPGPQDTDFLFRLL